MKNEYLVTPSGRQRANRLWVVVIAMTMAAVTIAFAWLRFSRPVDGTRLDTTASIWKQDGVIITENGGSTSGLRTGDLVTAVDGVSMQAWVQALFNPKASHPAYRLGTPIQYTVVRDGQPQQVEVMPVMFSLKSVLSDYWGALLFALVAQVVGTFVFIRRPDDTAPRILFVWSWLTCHTYAWSLGLQLSDIIQGNYFWLYSILTPVGWLLFWSATLHFGLVFPDEVVRSVSRPGRWLWIYLSAFLLFFVLSGWEYLRTGSVLAWIGSWSQVGYVISIIYLGLMIGLVIWSYQRTREPAARQKIQWVVFGAFISGFGGLLLWNLPPLILGRPLISANVLGVIVSIFPVTLAIAVLRHKLFDIDQIINRTVVYALLTTILGLIYFGTVVTLQYFFRTMTGERSQLTLVFSTLTTVVLFTPLRELVQKMIDRHFYRRKYNAQQTIERFAVLVRDEVELEAIEGALLSVVDNTLQPKQALLWLRKSASPAPDR